MSNRLIDYFLSFGPMSEEEQACICESMVLRQYKKHDWILRQGAVASECYFIMEGLVRQVATSDGNETTEGIFCEGDWLVSLQSFMQNSPAQHGWICMEDTLLVVGNAEREEAIFEAHPRLERFARKVMEGMLAQEQGRISAFLNESPTQRYLQLLQQKPNIFQRMPQYHIASYIGVKPESLSRIRRRLVKSAAENP